ncbi:MAG: hypothetical protein RIQ95_2124 [Pseudomonadota bacterium]|jgi:hypothetical protein
MCVTVFASLAPIVGTTSTCSIHVNGKFGFQLVATPDRFMEGSYVNGFIRYDFSLSYRTVFYLHRYLDTDFVFDGSSRRRQRQDRIGQGAPTSRVEPSLDAALVANQTRYKEKADLRPQTKPRAKQTVLPAVEPTIEHKTFSASTTASKR